MLKFKSVQRTRKFTQLGEEALGAFADKFQGELLSAGDAGYEEARAIWNAMIDRQPAVIAGCTGTADVVKAVNFARQNDLLLSVRGGGHNVAGNAVCDDGLMIDLSQMNGVHVNPEQRTARAGPGATLGDLDRETQLYGLAAPTGIVSETGLAGLTLGGGFGWLTRKHGFTSDNLRAVEVVTANGEVLQASEENNADLFWGIRGGGGNFGVVTWFEYDLHPVGPTVLAGMVLHPMGRARSVIRFYRDFVQDAPDALGSAVVMRLAPPAPFLPEALHGEPIFGILICYAGEIEAGRQLIQPLREYGDPLADKISPKPYVAVQSMLDRGQPAGLQYYSKSEYLSGLSDEAIDTAVEFGKSITSPETRVAVMQLGGKMGRIPEMATAASHRDAAFVFAINNGWESPEDNEKQIEWTRNFWEEIRLFSSGGSYVNFLSEGADEKRVQAAYGSEKKFERLVDLKNKYDPTNLFRMNQNIKPGPAKEV